MARMGHLRVSERVKQIWWGEAPERPDNTNEAADIGELQGHTTAMRVPSRGSGVSIVSRFGARNGRMDLPNEAFHLVHTIDRGSASVLV
jgi:hypothetical protein